MTERKELQMLDAEWRNRLRRAVIAERRACAELCLSMKTNPPANDPDDSERYFNSALLRASKAILSRTSDD